MQSGIGRSVSNQLKGIVEVSHEPTMTARRIVTTITLIYSHNYSLQNLNHRRRRSLWFL